MNDEIVEYCYLALMEFQNETRVTRSELMFVISDDLKGEVEGNRGKLFGVDVLFTKDIDNILIAKKYDFKGRDK